MTLRDLTPDFDKWPESWMGDEKDLKYGRKLLPFMEEFLNHLISQGLAARTLKGYVDNVWLLGGSIIKQVSIYDEYNTAPLTKLQKSVEFGGLLPDGYEQMTPRVLKAFERTCGGYEEFLKQHCQSKIT